MPISGPTNRHRYNTRDHFDFQQIWKQPRPFRGKPLPYHQRQATVFKRTGLEVDLGLPASNLALFDVGDQNNSLINNCYDKLKGKISDRAELMVAVLEAEKSLEMIRKRAVQLLNAVRFVSRGEFGRALKVLERADITLSPKTSKWKSATQNWMEYSFGWAPAVMDIGNAVNVLQSPLNSQFVKATATMSLPREWQDFSGPYSRSYERQMMIAVRMGCSVGVDNPNLWLANQLGFVNPATVAWEMIPFSFVVDWFINVGQFLASATDFLGLDIRDDYTTFFYKGSGRMAWSGATSPGGTLYSGETVYTLSGVDRQLGLTKPVFSVKPEFLTGWRRAAHAVSLLTIGLKSLR